MFGRGKRHHQQAPIQSGEALILDLSHRGGESYALKVLVETADEPFHAKLRLEARMSGLTPHKGERIPVRFDPVAQEVEWDYDTAVRRHAEQIVRNNERKANPVTDEQDIPARLAELETRRSQMTDWEFRVARSEIFKDAGL